MASLARFLDATAARHAAAPFDLESPRVLRLDLKGGVWLKPGAALAWRGDAQFERRPTIAATSLVDATLRELAPLVHASGDAVLFCAEHGSHVSVLRLAGDTVVVSWPDLLAFEETLTFEPLLVGHAIGVAAGGLAAFRLSGHGCLALATRGRPLTLSVTPDDPVTTDPHATVAWSADLAPQLRIDLGWRALLHHGGGEPIQMLFAGTGFVVVHSNEDPHRLHFDLHPLRRLATLVTG